MYHAKLRIDLLPMTANKMCGMGWRARHKHALEVKRIVHAELLSLRVIPEKPIKKAKLKLTRCSSKRPDYDGTVSSFKWVIDGLVRAGVLYDDNIDVIGEPEYKWESAGQHCGHIKIEITEI
jgi:Holliday junction resolvase RusA-like endonuclease